MTDEELICSLMEPKPAHWAEPGTATEWWVRTELGWMPYPLTLDALREVEERLTDEQWQRYAVTLDLATRTRSTTLSKRDVIHASAEHKIAALSEVLGQA